MITDVDCLFICLFAIDFFSEMSVEILYPIVIVFFLYWVLSKVSFFRAYSVAWFFIFLTGSFEAIFFLILKKYNLSFFSQDLNVWNFVLLSKDT